MPLKAIDGLPVFDAKRPLTLHVLKSDVAKADIKEPAGCAVARACRRELHVEEARIHLGRVYLRSNKGNWTRYITPRSMRSEIIAFDRGGTFEPGEFVLHVPQPTKRLGAKTGRKGKHSKNPTKRRPPHITTNVRSGPA